MKCQKCGKEMVLRSRKSDGKNFWGCSGYPNCSNIQTYVKGSEKTQPSGFKPIVKKEVKLPTPDSRFQQPILTAFLQNKQNLMVKACAGSGKTTLLRMLSHQLPKNKSIVYIVYNAKIRDEALSVLPEWVSPMTSHQLGFSAIRAYNGKTKTELENQKVVNIFKKLIQESWDEEKWMIGPVCALVSKLKNTLAPQDNATLVKIAERFNIDLNSSAFQIFDYAREVLRQNNLNVTTIDFDDMLYLVWKFKMPVQKFDIILTDECFPYKIPVLMENGVNLPIGKIVDEKMTGKVLTFNTETGKQEYKEIIGWHKIPNSKQLVKVLGVQFPDCNGGQRAAVTCTFNHKIWTKEDGWLEAEKLVPGYHHIQGETSAKTSQAYKITSKGRKVLSETITKNNELKKTGNYEGKYFGGGFEEKNRGGNGKGLTVPQRIYLDRLGEGWFSEYLVTPTKKQVSECRAASRYKIDIANPELKIAIELDGSLKKAEAIYEKKDKVLTELGWQVYHFENNYAVQNLETIVKDIYEKDCPVWCQVTSVEKTQVKEFYVYDITVEDNHNFYANGVLVHNCQDFNQAQLHLIKAASHESTQIIGVGDSDQCQPAGTKVVCAEGEEFKKKTHFIKNIEDIEVGDLVLSSYKSGTEFVYGQKVLGVSSRFYKGKLYTVSADSKETEATENHKWLVQWNETIKGKYCVYLMQKGDWFRIGCHKIFSGNSDFSILERVRSEKGEKIWILEIFDTKREALIAEQVISYTYGIPGLIFHADRWTNSIQDELFISSIYDNIPNLLERAVKCLTDFSKNVLYPFADVTLDKSYKRGFNTNFITESCNLISDVMSISSVEVTSKVSANWCPLVVKSRLWEGQVFSLDVKTTETYVANGLVTHNSMYGFRGADLEAMSRMQSFIQAKVMPLSITYRVPKSGVELVNQLFPDIEFEAAPWAKDGIIRRTSSEDFLTEVVESDMVLCRTNAPLIKPVLALLRQGIKACIAGRDLGSNLANLLTRFNKKGDTLIEVLEKLQAHRSQEMEKLTALGKDMAATNLADTVDTIIALSDGMRTVEDTIARIKSIFTDNNEGITFSTVHRAKGLEAKRVFILEPQLLPHPMAKSDWEQVQERNIAYVAITRHKEELVFVGQGLGSFAEGSAKENEVVEIEEPEEKPVEVIEVKIERKEVVIPVIMNCPF